MTERTRRGVLRGIGATSGLLLAGTAAGTPGKGRGGGDKGGQNQERGRSTVVSPDESIQAAVDAADPGDRVVIEGSHREQVIVDKDLTLVGRSEATILPPSGQLDNLSRLRPLLGVDGSDTTVDIENIAVDGEDRGSSGFYTGIGYFRADGTIREVTVERTSYGGYITQQRGGGGDQSVTVRDSRFTDLGFQPLVFNEPGTIGRVRGTTLVGTPGTTQYALTAGFGATVDVRRNVFRDFYAEGGFGIGIYAFDSANNTVQRNQFEDVQYPAYFLADSSAGASSSAGDSRFVRNTASATGVPDGASSFGTTVFANDPADDDIIETANNVKITNNEYTDFDTGVGTFTVGDGEVENTKIINNRFTRVDDPVDDNGDETKQQANRV